MACSKCGQKKSQQIKLVTKTEKRIAPNPLYLLNANDRKRISDLQARRRENNPPQLP